MPEKFPDPSYLECSPLDERVCENVSLVDGCRGNVEELVSRERRKAKVFEIGEGGENGRIVYASPQMGKMLRATKRLGDCDVNVLLTGETGVGKELVSRAIHYGSKRAKRPFMSVNCGAVASNIFESEFFGHKRGSFTGAVKAREGMLSAVGSGTLFLDEVGEMPSNLQIKLLRVLQERRFTPVGSNDEQDFRGRIICATNANLKDMVDNGTFREDLYYRIKVVDMLIPPLRERPDDIEACASDILSRMDGGYSIDPLAMEELRNHTLPGNVRQLQNILTSAAFNVERGNSVIYSRHLWS